MQMQCRQGKAVSTHWRLWGVMTAGMGHVAQHTGRAWQQSPHPWTLCCLDIEPVPQSSMFLYWLVVASFGKSSFLLPSQVPDSTKSMSPPPWNFPHLSCCSAVLSMTTCPSPATKCGLVLSWGSDLQPHGLSLLLYLIGVMMPSVKS
jgi:hypothetical protein